MGLSDVGIILLFLLGMALMVGEMFIPGAVMGLIGLTLVLASIYFAFQGGMISLGWILVAIVILSVPILIALWIKVLNRVMASKMTQKGTSGAQMHLKDLVGSEGVALTQLRPSGTVRIGDMKVDVVAESEVIERNARVKVVEVESNRVVVRAVTR